MKEKRRKKTNEVGSADIFKISTETANILRIFCLTNITLVLQGDIGSVRADA